MVLVEELVLSEVSGPFSVMLLSAPCSARDHTWCQSSQFPGLPTICHKQGCFLLLFAQETEQPV